MYGKSSTPKLAYGGYAGGLRFYDIIWIYLFVMVSNELLVSKIYFIRGRKVMLDNDLAELYSVETKRLKEAVRRNISRFPSDFMFEISNHEFESLRSQFATSNKSRGGTRYLPFAFAEQGVAMLSTVLKSETAIHMNTQIIRVFAKMREMLSAHKDILLKMEKIEKHITGLDEDIETIFQYLKKLWNPPQSPRQKIGFKRRNEE